MARSLRSYVIRRIAQMVPLIFGILIFNFTLIHLAPGDPAIIMSGERASPEFEDLIREKWGLTKPIHEQLIIYFSKALRGDFGYSIGYQRPVFKIIIQRIPATLTLIISSIIFALIIGVVLAAFSAARFGSKLDQIINMGSLALFSVPVFWFGLMLILVFAVGLDIFPATGMVDIRMGYKGLMHYFDLLHHLVLPVVTLGIGLHMPRYLRVARASIVEVMREDFITTARAKGLEERVVYFKHALRNALLPVVTMVGVRMGFVFSGATLTETIFGWPGLGSLMYEAIFLRDYPLIMGIFILTSITVVTAQLITDLVYAYLDPRVVY